MEEEIEKLTGELETQMKKTIESMRGDMEKQKEQLIKLIEKSKQSDIEKINLIYDIHCEVSKSFMHSNSFRR